MPVRQGTPAGAPCWIDLFTADTGRARDFYGSLFGWTSEDKGPDFGGYVNFSKDGHLVAGCMANDGQSGAPDQWSVYLQSDDAAATVAASDAQGGTTIVPPMAVADLGSMAVVSDKADAAIGIWQPGTHRGFGIIAEANTPAWFELHTRDYDIAAIRYYTDVFGWNLSVMSESPEFRYSTLGEGDNALAGIMDASNILPAGVPSHWEIYFAVADTDASVESIVRLGGSIEMPAVDTPHGRMAAAADPTGATFKVIQALP